MNAERIMLAGGLTAFFLTIYLVRRRTLREKYAMAWTILAVLLLLAGIFPNAIMVLADEAHLSYPAAVLLFSLGAIYLFSFAVSVTLSRQYLRNVRVIQELALLEERIRTLEKQRGEQHGERGASTT